MKLTEIQNEKISNQHSIDNDLSLECDSLRQENQLFRNALDEWSKRFEQVRLENEQMIK